MKPCVMVAATFLDLEGGVTCFSHSNCGGFDVTFVCPIIPKPWGAEAKMGLGAWRAKGAEISVPGTDCHVNQTSSLTRLKTNPNPKLCL